MSHPRVRSGALDIILIAAMLAIGSWPASAQRPALRTFGVADGLPTDAVSTLLIDSRGFLWVGTRMGVSRFDGARFVNYNTSHGLPGPIVNDILEDRHRRIWVATNGGGIARLEPDGSPGAPDEQAAPLFRVFQVGSTGATNRVNTLHQDSVGRLWAATDDGLFRSDDPTSPRFDRVQLATSTERHSPVGIAHLAESPDGTLWLGSFGGLFSLLADGTVVSHAGTSRTDQRAVQGLIVDRDGRVWAGSDIGLFILNPGVPVEDTSHQPHGTRSLLRAEVCAADRTGRRSLPERGESCHLPLPHGSIGDHIRSVIEMRDGRVVVINITGQIAEFDRGVFRWWLAAPDVPPASSVIEDSLGNVWVSNLSHGLRRVARGGLVSQEMIGTSRLQTILGQSGDSLLLAAGDWSVYRVEHGSISRVPLAPPPRLLPPPWGGQLLDRRGMVWLATGQGLLRFALADALRERSSTAWTMYTARDGLPGDAVGRLFEDSRGDIWISTGSGSASALARWESASGRIRQYPAHVAGGRFSQVVAFAEDRTGVVWITFRDGGMARVRGTQIELIPGTEELVSGELYVDRSGRIWASSLRGALRFDEPAASHPRPVPYTAREGLSSDAVKCFTEDRLGRIYIASAGGLDRLDVGTGAVRHYGSAEGLPLGEIVDAFTAADDTLWFITPVSIASLALDDDASSAPPSVRIGGMSVAGVPQPLSALGTETAGRFRFGPSQNSVQVDFFGLSADLVEPLRYQYRLEGLDRDWTPPTRDRSITYASLPPGSYRFGVRAVTAAGRSSESAAVVSFEILPPLWRRWWVIALALGVCGTAVYAAHRYRLSHLLRLERVRHRIATDLHDDIGASLSQIAILSDLGRSRLEDRDIEGTSQRLSTIAATSRELVDTMSDIVWAVNPHRDSVDDLVHRMRRFATDSLEAADVALKFAAPDEGATMRLGPDVRREILLILKESVTNIVRHAACTNAEIELQVDRHHLHLGIRDNGRGFDAAASGGGNGLRSMRRRVDALGGHFGIDSIPGRGTEVRLDIPIA